MKTSREIQITRAVTYMMVGAVVLLVGALLFGFYSNRTYNDRLCKQQNDSREVLRNVLLLSQAQAQTNKFPASIRSEDGTAVKVIITFPTLGQNNANFYRDALKLTPPVKC